MVSRNRDAVLFGKGSEKKRSERLSREIAVRGSVMADSEIERRLTWMRVAREIRSDFFDASLFINSPWDIMLEVYHAVLDERQISVADLTQTLPIPATTALRWLDTLVHVRLIRCSPPLFRGGVAQVELTQWGIRQMDAYFRRLPPVPDPA
jgi:hypothetical protein